MTSDRVIEGIGWALCGVVGFYVIFWRGDNALGMAFMAASLAFRAQFRISGIEHQRGIPPEDA